MGEERVRELGERAMLSIESRPWLDVPSYKLEHGVALTLNLLGNRTWRVRSFLHGTWFGHPLHPLLTDVPIGAWTAALVLDGLDAVRPRPPGYREATRATVAVGLAGGAAAALAGLADWQHVHDNARRTGLVHGLLNAGALGLCAASWAERRRGRLVRARAASALGYVATLASGYLGGSLVYRHRIGTDHADRSFEPRDFLPTVHERELEDDVPHRVEVEGIAVALVRHRGRIHALGDRCPHLGGPLGQGWLQDGALVCPWHGSHFTLEDGTAERGPATAPATCFEVRVRGGVVEVRRRPAVPATTPDLAIANRQEVDA